MPSELFASRHPVLPPDDVSSIDIVASFVTSCPPPDAPPVMCNLVSTNAVACWYRRVGALPGASAHSQRPSRCLAKPYASFSAKPSAPRPPQSSNRPSLRVLALAYVLALGTGPLGAHLVHSYGFVVVSNTHVSSKHFEPSVPPITTKNLCATKLKTCAYRCPGPCPRTCTRCHFGSLVAKSNTYKSSSANPSGPMPPSTTSIPPTVAAPCAARGLGTSPPHSNFPHSPLNGSKTCNSFVAPLSLTHAPASRPACGLNPTFALAFAPLPPSSSVAPPNVTIFVF